MIEFGPLQIEYDDRVLQPRPWTARQSEWAAELIARAPDGPVLELCAGAGHIGLLAVTRQPRPLVCVDADPVACGFARANAARAGLGDRVEVRQGDLEAVLDTDERFAVVIADPPWVPSSEAGRFPEDPLTAIDGGVDGMGPARACVRVIDRHLAPGGAAVLQLGTEEQAAVIAGELPEGLAAAEVRAWPGEGTLVLLERAPVGHVDGVVPQ